MFYTMSHQQSTRCHKQAYILAQIL